MNDLIKSISIANLLQQREAIFERLDTIHATLVETKEIAEAAGIADDEKLRSFAKLVGEKYHKYTHFLPLLDHEDVTRAKKRIDNAAWAHLMDESGLMAFMNSTAREKWANDVSDGNTPQLTLDNIRATFQVLYENRGDMLENGVIECFKHLSWCYKTNQPQKFGRRIVKRIRQWGYVSHEMTNSLEDLNRAMAAIDGKPQDDNRHALYQRLRAAEGAVNSRRDQFTHEDTYMDFRVFKNGNAHITFRRPELVERMNRILAKHYPNALPEPKD